MFTLGNSYTRKQIGRQLGGSHESYLPIVKGRVVCGCFDPSKDPDAPSKVLVGAGPDIEAAGRQLAVQRQFVPVFIKHRTNAWEYVGNFRVARSDTTPKALIEEGRRSGRTDVMRILHLELEPDAQRANAEAHTEMASSGETAAASGDRTDLIADQVYDGDFIQRHYGNPQHFLLTRDRILTACCFQPEKNPRIHEHVLLVGNGLHKYRAAVDFAEQGHPIPFFEKQHTDAWKYWNHFRVKDSTEEPVIVKREAKLAGDFDAKIVLYLEVAGPSAKGEQKRPVEVRAEADESDGFNRTFTSEFAGKRKPYCANQSVESINTHGSVVNGLWALLNGLRIPAYNTRAVDLYLMYGESAVTHIFEVKTDTESSTLYGAVGQLMLHAAGFDSLPKRILVVPELPEQQTCRKLEKLGILTVTYSLDGNGQLTCDVESVL